MEPNHSLLRGLEDVIVRETRLLGGVRRDLHYICDEMESMSAFIMTAEANNGEDDHLVVAWNNQVKNLLTSSHYYVNQYVGHLDGGHRSSICCGPVGEFFRLLATIPARHQLATHIRDLKIQAREVGERQLRYGATLTLRSPPQLMPTHNQKQPQAPADDPGDSQSQRRRTIVEDYDLFTDAAAEIINCIKEEQDGGGDVIAPEAQQLKVIPILGPPGTGKTTLAQKVYDMYSKSGPGCHVAWVSPGREQSVRKTLATILAIIGTGIEGIQNIRSWEQDTIEGMIKTRLPRTKLLVVVDDVRSESFCSQIRQVLNCGCCAGSALLLVTTDTEVANSCSPHKIYNFDYYLSEHLRESAVSMLLERAVSLHLHDNKAPDIEALRDVLRSIIIKCSPYLFSMNMLLRCLYVNPDRKIEDLQELRDSLDESSPTNVDKMIDFCYRSLPSRCRNCLAYLAISPTHDNTFKRSTLVRQWIAEGLISGRNDVGKRCYDTLCDHKFLVPAVGDGRPGSPYARSRYKVSTVQAMVLGFLSSIGEVHDAVDPMLFPDMVQRISVQKGVLQAGGAREGRNRNLGGVVTHLISLSSYDIQLLKVLDLECCTGFQESHLRTICTVALGLKYLSLRNVPGVNGLPEQIQNLKGLETLDIRGTNVPSVDSVLSVKNLLVGRMDGSSFSTVKIPRDIRTARNIEVLFHVDVSHRDDSLMQLDQLQMLRKLGVVVGSNQNPQVMRLLFSKIGMLENCLRSLSIMINNGGNNPLTRYHRSLSTMLGGESTSTGYNIVGSNMSPPKKLHILRIHGAIFGLPRWISGLHQLTKISLCNTCLTDESLYILGKLPRLRSLFLRNAMTKGTALVFQHGEFKEMQDLFIEAADSSVRFEDGTASNLERIVFKNADKMFSLRGVRFLQCLKELEIVQHNTVLSNLSVVGEDDIRSNLMNRITYIHNGQVKAY